MEVIDPALKPSHYKAPCSYPTARIILKLTGFEPENFDECKDLIKAANADYFTGAAIKYLWRCAKKGEYYRDLGKAIEHLQEVPRSLSRSQTIHEIRGLMQIFNTGEFYDDRST
jgi:hypothetical protein